MISKKDLLKLVSKLNKQDKIIGAYKMKKEDLIKKVEELKYDIEHDKKELRPRVEMKRRKVIKL